MLTVIVLIGVLVEVVDLADKLFWSSHEESDD
jgi:hypothetical protein